MKTTFTLPLLNLITVDCDAKQILEQAPPRRKLQFVRNSILKLANEYGFVLPSKKPDYMSNEKWQKFMEAKQKSQRVDYSYVIAYYWLKSLPKFSYREKSHIIRRAIKEYSS